MRAAIVNQMRQRSEEKRREETGEGRSVSIFTFSSSPRLCQSAMLTLTADHSVSDATYGASAQKEMDGKG